MIFFLNPKKLVVQMASVLEKRCTSSIMTIAAVVKQEEGDKYLLTALFCHSSTTWLGTTNVHRQFPVSSAHVCVQSVRKNIREDLEDRWVTNLSEDRKRFYLVASQLDPHTKMLSLVEEAQARVSRLDPNG